MIKVSELSPHFRSTLNWLIIIGSVLLCAMFSLTRLPGMQLQDIGPQWLLIWVVAWSVKRTPFQGAIAGLALGAIQDGLTSSYPSHIISLTLIGFLTARLQKQRYIQEDFISIALIVFAMTAIAETITAIQYSLYGFVSLEKIWVTHQRAVLLSATLSSLWGPIVYWPLNRWWQQIEAFEQ
ncbi:MAG: rod shape-determining protein MreD [Spirulinaceae cyanobacterium]